MAASGFSKEQRLLTAADFQHVFDHSRLKASSRTLLLLAADNRLPQSRIGFIIAKKQVRTAVQRNRIKRITRDYFRLHCHELRGYDIIFLARRGLDQMSNPQIRSQFEYLWRKLCRLAQKQQAS